MLKGLLVTVVLVLAVVAVAGAAGPELKSDEQKTLYALGFVISQNLASFALSPADLEVVLTSVIKCWTEGVPMMKVGGKSKLVCPSDIAYGDQGRPPIIKPGATLVFEIELLEIVK